MAKVHVRLHIKRAGAGVALDRLGKLAQEVQKLMRMMGREVALDPDGQWIATNFQEGSLYFDTEYIGQADEGQAREYAHLVEAVDHARRDRASVDVPLDILRQYAVVGDSLAPGESLRLGVFYNGDDVPARWSEVSKQESTLLLESIDLPIEYHGSVQGIVHSLYKESNPPYFDLRDLAGARLVKCFYSQEQYGTVVSLLKKPDAVVLVSGRVRASRGERKVEQVVVDRMAVAKPIALSQFKRLIGSAPRLTGHLSTSQFIDRIRGD